ncbi:MAG TPA: hypothetical protein VGP26_21150 [Actinophytocola sp.]|nr:hypothetical protein [Actinophytocola sp.]
MDQATSTARDTAAFARRVVLRTLTVVGGAAAGTVIAWCLSTAGASADTGLTTPKPVPVVGSFTAPVTAPVAAPISGAIDKAVESAARHLSDPPPAHAIEQLGEKVKHAASSFRGHAAEKLPECTGALCGLEHVGRSAAPVAGDGAGLGRSDSPTPAPAAVPPAATGKVATPGVDPDQTAERTATGRAYLDGMPRRGSPAPGMPSFPGFPASPAPFAPATPVPASGHTGSAGNPADSSLFAALPWQDRTPALVRGLTVPATEATTFGRVGAQPGVAPD